VAVCLKDHYTRSSITITDKSQYEKKSKRPQPVIHPNATAASIANWLRHWRSPSVPPTDKRRLEFITIKADASLFDFDKSDGSFAGKTTLEQLREIERRIVATIKGEDAHVRIVSKLLDIEKGHERRKHSAIEPATKRKKKAKKEG